MVKDVSENFNPDDIFDSAILKFSIDDWVYKDLITGNEIYINENVLNILDTTVKYIYDNITN
jgi:hypothetical protein